MSGLSRIVALYRLLERVRERDALLAGAAFEESSQELRRLLALQRSLTEGARVAVDDPVGRFSSAVRRESCAVLQDRVQLVETERLLAKQTAMAEVAVSRQQSRQVETVLEQQRSAAAAAREKREQALSDERFLAQRHRRKGF